MRPHNETQISNDVQASMAIKLDIMDHMGNPHDKSHPFAFDDLPFAGSGSFADNEFFDFKLIGEVGDWLRAHGHEGSFRNYQDLDDMGAWVFFDDPDLATMFKLTWL